MSIRLSRRAFGLGALAAPLAPVFGQSCAPPAHGSATPVSFSGLTVVQRKAVSALTPNEVNRLRLAYQRLRDLTASTPNDPRGWMQQANVHCFNCAGAGDVHGSWTFLPWHRAFLFTHEQILCKLLADPTFRLPYWDWDAVISRKVPGIYRTPNTTAANSLFDANRGANSGGTMPAGLINANNNPMNSASFAQFGGTAGAAGSFENGIHGAVHIWTADPTMSSAALDMGRLNTAARDPVFYAHHCNIDRLWAEWIRRDPMNHKNPTAAAFLNKTFSFFDQNSQWKSLRTSDLLNTATLGYSYPPGAALSTPKPLTRRLDVTLNSAKSVTLTAATKARLQGGSGGLNVARALVIEGVATPSAAGLYFIYAGAPPTAGEKTAAPNYLGYLAIPDSEHVHSHATTLILEPAKGFVDAAAGAGTTLTVVPSTATGAALAGTRLVYESIHIVEEA
jgi:polyphenol oxidase